ncbi:MAG: hypothetical protein MJ094_08540 [Saccharofermentans sp.]|nr:hypothetical protein [Saccharofermentans sp.]
MDIIKKISNAKSIEALVATIINAVMAVIGCGIFFVSMFADPSFGFGSFFFYNFLLGLLVVISVAFLVISRIEVSSVKKIISGENSVSSQKKQLNFLAIIQIVIAGIYILAFFIVTTIALLIWINHGAWTLILTEYIFGSTTELLAIANVIENIIAIRSINKLI